MAPAGDSARQLSQQLSGGTTPLGAGGDVLHRRGVRRRDHGLPAAEVRQPLDRGGVPRQSQHVHPNRLQPADHPVPRHGEVHRRVGSGATAHHGPCGDLLLRHGTTRIRLTPRLLLLEAEGLGVASAFDCESAESAAALLTDDDFNELHAAITPRLRSIACRRYALQCEDAEELIQKAWLLFLEKCSSAPQLNSTIQAASGRTIRKMLPRGDRLACSIVPSCASTASLQKLSPSPTVAAPLLPRCATANRSKISCR